MLRPQDTTTRTGQSRPEPTQFPIDTVPLPSLDDASRFYYDTVNPILRKANGANLGEVRATLATIFQNERDRTQIFTFLSHTWISEAFSVEIHKLLVEMTIPYLSIDETGPAADVIASAGDFAITLRDLEFYKYLGEEFCRNTIPPELVWHSATLLCNLDCVNVSQAPCLQPWMRFLSQQGTREAFYQISLELLSRLGQGHLSCYDHLLTALCNPGHGDALDVLGAILQRCPSTPPSREPQVPEIDLKKVSLQVARESLKTSFRTLPLAAIITMTSIGPEYALSVYSVLPSVIIGFTSAFIKEVPKQLAILKLSRGVKQPEPSSFPATKVKYAHREFAEKSLELLKRAENPSHVVRSFITFLEIRLGKIQEPQ